MTNDVMNKPFAKINGSLKRDTFQVDAEFNLSPELDDETLQSTLGTIGNLMGNVQDLSVEGGRLQFEVGTADKQKLGETLLLIDYVMAELLAVSQGD